MPSLHLDIPSIDWTPRPSAPPSGGGKASPVGDAPAPAPAATPRRPAPADGCDPAPWAGWPAGVAAS